MIELPVTGDRLTGGSVIERDGSLTLPAAGGGLLLDAMNRLHAREGSRLLTRWNMPEQYHVIARDHHAAEVDADNHLLLLVRLANLVCRKLGIGLEQDNALDLAATPEAELLRLTGRDLAELELALEDSRVLTS